jgi:hypothetical protein
MNGRGRLLALLLRSGLFGRVAALLALQIRFEESAILLQRAPSRSRGRENAETILVAEGNQTNFRREAIQKVQRTKCPLF